MHWVKRCRGGAEPRSGGLRRLLGAFEVAAGCFFSCRTRARRAECQGYWYFTFGPGVCSFRTRHRLSGRFLTGVRSDNWRMEPVFLRFGLGLLRHSVARSTELTYMGHVRSWCQLRRLVGKLAFLSYDNDGAGWLGALMGYSSYAFMAKGLQDKTIAGDLFAVKCLHR